MTRQEFNDLYDSLYYGHDAELEVDGQQYFVEWDDGGIDIYILKNNAGTKISSIAANEKCELLSALFDFKFNGTKSLCTSYAEIKIIDIE